MVITKRRRKDHAIRMRKGNIASGQKTAREQIKNV